MAESTDFDVVVLGAGPSGSSAAIELSRAGRSVLVVEKRRFPRDKVCGGCLSGSAVARLRELIGTDRALPGTPGKRVTFVMGAYRLACDPGGATWMVTRAELDACLAQVAADCGAEMWFGDSATLERGDSCWEVAVGRRRVRGKSVLVGTGIGGMLSQIGIDGQRTSRPMIAQQWIQPPIRPLPAHGEVELHWLRGGYVGLATPKPGMCVVALAAEAPGHGEESAFERLRRLNPEATVMRILGPDAPQRYKARGSAGFPWNPTRLGDANLLLIGDAAGFAEPYSGEGIGQALCSASCATEAILGGVDILKNYTALMRRRHHRVVWRTRMISSILSSRVMHALASRWPVVPRSVLTPLVRFVHVKGAI